MNFLCSLCLGIVDDFKKIALPVLLQFLQCAVEKFFYRTFHGPIIHFFVTFYFIYTLKCDQKVEYGTIKVYQYEFLHYTDYGSHQSHENSFIMGATWGRKNVQRFTYDLVWILEDSINQSVTFGFYFVQCERKINRFPDIIWNNESAFDKN